MNFNNLNTTNVSLGATFIVLILFISVMYNSMLMKKETAESPSNYSESIPISRYVQIGNYDSAFINPNSVSYCASYVGLAMTLVTRRESHTKEEALQIVNETLLNRDPDSSELSRMMAIGAIDKIWEGGENDNYVIETRDGFVQAYYVSLLFNSCLDKFEGNG